MKNFTRIPAKSVAQKARDLLQEIGGEDWVNLNDFDPPFGKSEVTYCTSKGFIEAGVNGRVRITPRGRSHLMTKKRSDAK